MDEKNEKFDPVFITDKESGKRYELDFSRDSVKAAEKAGLKLDRADDTPRTSLELLFFYAFRMHHPTMSKEKTDDLLGKMGGMTTKLIDRLGALYNQALTANLIKVDDEDYEKNTEVAVEL